MSILVTGAAGFIGSNFVLDWIAAGLEEVVSLDKLTYAGNRENLASLDGCAQHRFVLGAIEDEALVSDLLAAENVTAVVNFAAESHVDRSIVGPGAFIDTNVVGTFKLLDAVRRYWSGLSAERQDNFRFLHVSTDEVYGSLGPDELPFSESNPYRPNSPYAASKAASDHLVRSYGETYGLPVLITNCSNNYGPYHFPEKLIPLVIHNALRGKPLPLYGDGKQVRDWLYVKDHCSALRAVLKGGRPGQTYNVGGESERANIDVVKSVCDILDRLRPLGHDKTYADQITFVKDRPGHDRRYAIDARKLKSELGWRPLESFESGLEKTIRWNLDNSGWVERVTSGAYRDWVARHYA
ncbi:dTDP-glucose 4,6-dehydratase [Bradyrhizobium sp. STM 3562]|uniref:dTDP-glucose 4,6-dehydratase n=1 Tax=Bradyrhizobium sp. STM 3562 TaxID=578924 RepID=UPI00388EA79A